MSGGWAGSNRRNELPGDWPQRRRHVLDRDEHRCRNRINGRICARWANQVDHIGDKHDHRIEMLQALCETCHNAKSSRQGNDARWAERATRAPERHPGLI